MTAHSYYRRVAWSDVDPLGIYRHTALLDYVGEAEIDLMRVANVIDDLVPRLPRTFLRADFHLPGRFGDIVEIQVGVGYMGRSAIEFDFEAVCDSRHLAAGTVGTAFLGDNGRPTPVPTELRKRLLPFVVSRGKEQQ